MTFLVPFGARATGVGPLSPGIRSGHPGDHAGGAHADSTCSQHGEWRWGVRGRRVQAVAATNSSMTKPICPVRSSTRCPRSAATHVRAAAVAASAASAVVQMLMEQLALSPRSARDHACSGRATVLRTRGADGAPGRTPGRTKPSHLCARLVRGAVSPPAHLLLEARSSTDRAARAPTSCSFAR